MGCLKIENLDFSQEVSPLKVVFSKKSALDYYPFGMEMDGRKNTSETYRYGFNGKEKDPEWDGQNGAYDFKERIYDSRIGRFMAEDRFGDLFDESPYSTSKLNPIIYTDNGNWPIITIIRELIHLESGALEVKLEMNVKLDVVIVNLSDENIDMNALKANLQTHSSIASGNIAGQVEANGFDHNGKSMKARGSKMILSDNSKLNVSIKWTIIEKKDLANVKYNQNIIVITDGNLYSDLGGGKAFGVAGRSSGIVSTDAISESEEKGIVKEGGGEEYFQQVIYEELLHQIGMEDNYTPYSNGPDDFLFSTGTNQGWKVSKSNKQEVADFYYRFQNDLRQQSWNKDIFQLVYPHPLDDLESAAAQSGIKNILPNSMNSGSRSFPYPVPHTDYDYKDVYWFDDGPGPAGKEHH